MRLRLSMFLVILSFLTSLAWGQTQTLYAPHFSTEAPWSSSLLITNKWPAAITVTPYAYVGGQPFAISPVNVPARSFVRVPVSLANASGPMELSFQAPTFGALSAVVRLEGGGLHYSVPFTGTMDWPGNRFTGAVARVTGATSSVAVYNTDIQPVTVKVTAYPSGFVETFTLGAKRTRIVNLAETGGAVVEHNGAGNTVVAEGYAYGPGHASNFIFVSDRFTYPIRYIAPAARADRGLTLTGFNASTAVATISATVTYTRADTSRASFTNVYTLAPNQVITPVLLPAVETSEAAVSLTYEGVSSQIHAFLVSPTEGLSAIQRPQNPNFGQTVINNICPTGGEGATLTVLNSGPRAALFDVLINREAASNTTRLSIPPGETVKLPLVSGLLSYTVREVSEASTQTANGVAVAAVPGNCENPLPDTDFVYRIQADEETVVQNENITYLDVYVYWNWGGQSFITDLATKTSDNPGIASWAADGQLLIGGEGDALLQARYWTILCPRYSWAFIETAFSPINSQLRCRSTCGFIRTGHVNIRGRDLCVYGLCRSTSPHCATICGAELMLMTGGEILGGCSEFVRMDLTCYTLRFFGTVLRLAVCFNSNAWAVDRCM